MLKDEITQDPLRAHIYEFRFSVFAYLFRDEGFAKATIDKIPDWYFSTSLKDWNPKNPVPNSEVQDSDEWLFETLKRVLVKGGYVLPARQHLAAYILGEAVKELKTSSVPDEDQQLMLRLIARRLKVLLYDPPFFSAELVKEDFYRSLRAHQIRVFLHNYPELIRKAEETNDFGPLDRAYYDAHHGVAEREKPWSYEENWRDAIFARDRDPRIATGLTAVDEFTHGGLKYRHVGVVGAATDGGKTACLSRIAAQAMCEGKRVAYISLETFRDDISNMITSHMAEIERNLLGVTIKKVDKAMDARFAGMPDGRYLNVQALGPKGMSVSGLRAWLEEERIIHGGLGYDLVIVDYFNNFKWSSQREQLYVIMREDMASLALVAKDMNVAIWTAAQLNREGAKGEPKIEHYAGSWDAMNLPSLVLTMYHPNSERDNRLVAMKVHKCKYEQGKPTFYMDVDFSQIKWTAIDKEQGERRSGGVGRKKSLSSSSPTNYRSFSTKASPTITVGGDDD